MTLQKYLERNMKLRARAHHGKNLDPCGEYLLRHKPKTVSKLFEIMQEYCISDRGKRQRLEEMNEQKKARNSERSHLKPWHADQAKHQKTVNNVSEEEPRDSRHHSKREE